MLSRVQKVPAVLSTSYDYCSLCPSFLTPLRLCLPNSISIYVSVIPQSCWYKGIKFDCGLSISCVLAGGKPLDLCSGGMIWSCCVSPEKITVKDPNINALQNASKFILFHFIINLVAWQVNRLSLEQIQRVRSVTPSAQNAKDGELKSYLPNVRFE